MRLAALNEEWSDDSSSEPTEERVKEARESEALELYNQALQHQQLGNHGRAKEYYEKLLNASVVTDVDDSEINDGQPSHPGLVFKYSAYKNLASLAENDNDDDKAVDLYLEAAAIDDSDVTLWYKIGKLAVKLGNLRLARYSFEQGLNINSKHWPCLDELVTVLYAIGDYHSCLMIVSSAFERDTSYPKGLIMREKIYSEFSSFRNEYQNLRGMSSARHVKCDQDLACQLINEALDLRKKNRERNVLPEPPAIIPAKHLALYTWSSLGDCLAALYDQVTSDDNSLNLGQKVNLESYCKIILPPEIVRANVLQKLFVKDNEDKRSSNSLKRKKFVAEESDPFNAAPKRRSARVNKSKKKQEEVNYLELLQEFLPETLRTGSLVDGNEDSQNPKMDTQEIDSELDVSNIPDISCENEPLDVQTFVKKHMEKCGTLDLLCDYAIHLSDNCNLKWSASLVEAFLKIYSRIRPHLSFPALFSQDSIKSEIVSSAKLTLVAIELTLDKWCTEKSKSSSSLSPAGSPRGVNQSTATSPLKQDFLGKYFLNDLEYIAQASRVAFNLLEKEGLQFALRVNWAKVRFMMFQGQMNLAVIYLDRCKTLIELSETPLAVVLVNCKADNIINISQVRKKLESLQRCQSLEEVHRLYESGQYQDVVDVLLSSLHHPPPVTKLGSGGMSIPERPAQLLLLQDSLLKIKDYKTCLTCAEVAFNEAVAQMTPCEAWATTFERIFTCMNTILSMDITMVDSLSSDKLHRLTQNLIKVIEVSMESSENSSELPLATVMPWILLYRIIHSKENVGESQAMDVDERASESTPTKPPESEKSEESPNKETTPPKVVHVSLPLSLQFLRLAHEALGGRSWCINNDGIFLLLFVEVFWKCLPEKSPAIEQNRPKVLRELEQCFFCLYGHPSKKAKARGLQEHGSTQISLTWPNSEVVFEFFKPAALPTFEDKTHTVTTEVQNLLRRITLVIPQNELDVITVESVQNYIDGSTDVEPKLPDHLAGVERPVIGEIFYLLADSYFKNKEFSKAIKFYIHDICSNPNRFDTWAAMALARQVRLEDKLRACEQKSEGPIQKHSVSTLRCFKRALEIDSSNTNLWGEEYPIDNQMKGLETQYGSLSYCLHSYASRQLNQVEALTPETKSTLEDRRRDMLTQAKKCFNEALHKPDNDEPWLQHYMLGKIAEKMCRPAEEYLESYLKALEELDKDDAEYPRKISYHNPPNLALEALEVAFRFHSSAIKLLVKCEDETQYVVVNDYLDRVSRCPFYQAKSKASKDDEQASKASPEKTNEDKEAISNIVNEKSDSSEPSTSAKPQTSDLAESSMTVCSNSQGLVTADTPNITDTIDSVETKVKTEDTGLSETENMLKNRQISETDTETMETKQEKEEQPPQQQQQLQQQQQQIEDKPTNENLELKPSKDDVCLPENIPPAMLEDMSVSSGLVSKEKLIQRCLEALAICLQRFPQHYKSQYRLAHAYLNILSVKNAKLSRDLLLGSNFAGDKPFNLSIQGLFNEKSKTNLFQGIWRIPLDDVDRPGSFCSHMHRCVRLLIDVLNELKEWHSLLLVSTLMYRSPDTGKKYLRDSERLQLASKAFTLSLKLLNGRLEECKKLPKPSEVAITLLTDAHEAYKCSQKVQKYGEETEKLMVEVFELSDLRKNDSTLQEEGRKSESSVMDEILKYFQQQTTQAKPQTSVVEHDEKNNSQSKPGDDASMNKPELSPAVKSNDSTKSNDVQKPADAESTNKITSNDRTSPNSSSDSVFTSPKVPPLIPDADKQNSQIAKS